MTEKSFVDQLRDYADGDECSPAKVEVLLRKAADEIERLQRWIFMLDNSTSSEVLSAQLERDRYKEFVVRTATDKNLRSRKACYHARRVCLEAGALLAEMDGTYKGKD